RLRFSRWKKISPVRWIEGAGLWLSILGITLVLFAKLRGRADVAFLYLPVPCLLWAAVRFKFRGAAMAVAVITFLAIWGGTLGRGPFADESADQNALSIQLFLIFMSVPLLFLAALIEERDKVLKALREGEERNSIDGGSDNLALWTDIYGRGESWGMENGRGLYHYVREG